MIPVEDTLAIQNLLHRYAIYVDTQQIDSLMTLFTEDVLFDESAIGLEPTQGTAALRAGFQKGFAALSHNFHMIGNNVITQFDGASAAGQCHFFAKAQLAANGTRLNMAGYYQDLYRKSDHAEWRIASRVLVLLMPVEKIRA